MTPTTEPGDAGPVDPPPGAEWFTLGLVLDVAKVLEAHGYERLTGRQHVELQQHLFHFLHGAQRGDERCYGGAR